MERLSRRQVVLGMLPCFAALLGVCGVPQRGNQSGGMAATTTQGTPRIATVTRAAVSATPSVVASTTVIATAPIASATRASSTATSRFVNPQGTPSRTLPPLPYRQVPYDPATAIGGVPGYFFVPESLPIDPRHADLLRTLWRYYEVRFAGEATLQTARFTEVMDGQALTTARTTIDSLRGTGRGRRYLSLDGTLHPQAAEQQPATLDEVKPLLMEYTTDRAELFSRFNAFIVPTDPASGYLAERIPDHDEAVEEFFTVRRIAGDWKVSVASFGPFRE